MRGLSLFGSVPRPAVVTFAIEAAAVILAVLDVWLVLPEKAQPYSIWLSGAACLAVVFRRKFPFLAVLVAVPGSLRDRTVKPATRGTTASPHVQSITPDAAYCSKRRPTAQPDAR